jgi:hypothetical protein
LSGACASYGATIGECYYDGDPAMAAYWEMYCNEGIAFFSMISGQCALAFEEFAACIGASSCQELMSETVCQAENMAVDTVCQPG